MVSDFERFEKIKAKRMKESCVGGLWWVLGGEDRAVLEGSDTERTLPCGGP